MASPPSGDMLDYMQSSFPAENSFDGSPRNQVRATREQVSARAYELAVIAGRVPPHVSQIDYEQAKRELTGESDLDRQTAVLDSGDGAAVPRFRSS